MNIVLQQPMIIFKLINIIQFLELLLELLAVLPVPGCISVRTCKETFKNTFILLFNLGMIIILNIQCVAKNITLDTWMLSFLQKQIFMSFLHL